LQQQQQHYENLLKMFCSNVISYFNMKYMTRIS
jgi:hypothetical protein